jgi:hypothetical protein
MPAPRSLDLLLATGNIYQFKLGHYQTVNYLAFIHMACAVLGPAIWLQDDILQTYD